MGKYTDGQTRRDPHEERVNAESCNHMCIYLAESVQMWYASPSFAWLNYAITYPLWLFSLIHHFSAINLLDY